MVDFQELCVVFPQTSDQGEQGRWVERQEHSYNDEYCDGEGKGGCGQWKLLERFGFGGGREIHLTLPV